MLLADSYEQIFYSFWPFSPKHLENERNFQLREDIFKTIHIIIFFLFPLNRSNFDIIHCCFLVICVSMCVYVCVCELCFQWKYCILPWHHFFCIRLFTSVHVYPCFRAPLLQMSHINILTWRIFTTLLRVFTRIIWCL